VNAIKGAPADTPLRQPMRFKAQAKAALQRQPVLWNSYWRVKQEFLRLWMLRFFWCDVRNVYLSMTWPSTRSNSRALESELLFQYHKLEKGLVIPGSRRLFGVEPAARTIELMQRWKRLRPGNLHDPIYLGAVETLRSYHARLIESALDPSDLIRSRVKSVLDAYPTPARYLTTPVSLPRAAPTEDLAHSFESLAQMRRSVRDFMPTRVDRSIVQAAVRLAQLSPSVCNRQPWFVYVTDDPQKIASLMSYQTGNRGFGHLVPLLAVITCDERCFYDATERHEQYVDGGLFSMSFALALTAHGLGTCCLNWCVPPSVDHAVHQEFRIPATNRIIMMMAIGQPPLGCMVPRSPRRDPAEVLIDL